MIIFEKIFDEESYTDIYLDLLKLKSRTLVRSYQRTYWIFFPLCFINLINSLSRNCILNVKYGSVSIKHSIIKTALATSKVWFNLGAKVGFTFVSCYFFINYNEDCGCFSILLAYCLIVENAIQLQSQPSNRSYVDYSNDHLHNCLRGNKIWYNDVISIKFVNLASQLLSGI